MKNANLKIYIKRAAGLFVLCAVIFSCAAAVSCGTDGSKKEASPVVMTLNYGKNTTTLTSDIYSYYLAYMKTSLLYSWYNLDKDDPEIWEEEYTGGEPDIKTVGDYAKKEAEASLKSLLAAAAYCKDKKIELSQEQLNTIDEEMKTLLSDEKYGKSKAKLNDVLGRFNMDYDTLREIKKYDALKGAMVDYLFGTDTGVGKISITDSMMNQIYKRECVRVKHILVTYPGTYDADGNYEEYSEEKLEEQAAKAQDIYDRITLGGEDFDSLLHESEDPGGISYPDGYTLSRNSSYMPEFLEAAFEMEIGDVKIAQTEYGFHIMKRYALIAAANSIDIDSSNLWGTEVYWRDSIYMDIQNEKILEELQPYLDKIKILTEETDLISVTSSDVMFDCLEITR